MFNNSSISPPMSDNENSLKSGAEIRKTTGKSLHRQQPVFSNKKIQQHISEKAEQSPVASTQLLPF